MSDKDVLARSDRRMDQAVVEAQKKLATLRTGRATIGILDGVTVDYYGTPTPLNQVARLSVPEATLIVAQPFDTSMLSVIEKAIQAADLGLHPASDGKLVRIPVPSLTEERRRELAKKVRALIEEAKTAVRQVRREANEEAKALERDGLISEDDSRRLLEQIQKGTDRHTKSLTDLSLAKEKELLEI